MYNSWNPWHGCRKRSPGCKYCYVYRQDEMYGSEISSSEIRKTGNFNLPVKKKQDKSYKIPSGELVYTCLTSDFFMEEANLWRDQTWEMIHQRDDLMFFIFTKRIDRFEECVPQNWESGNNARVCDYQWILNIRQQCIQKDIPFCFHQTGAKFLKNGQLYRIKRWHQMPQAKKQI